MEYVLQVACSDKYLGTPISSNSVQSSWELGPNSVPYFGLGFIHLASGRASLYTSTRLADMDGLLSIEMLELPLKDTSETQDAKLGF